MGRKKLKNYKFSFRVWREIKRGKAYFPNLPETKFEIQNDGRGGPFFQNIFSNHYGVLLPFRAEY